MKRYFTTLISTALTIGITLPLTAQDEPEQPAQEPVPAQTEEANPNTQDVLQAVIEAGANSATEESVPATTEEGTIGEPESFVRQGSTPSRFVAPGATNRTSQSENFSLDSVKIDTTPADKVIKDGERGIRLNFRNAPLDMVLDHLSSVAGFIIVPETDVREKIDVWSNQPLTKDEAVDLLDKVLGKKGYAVIRDGRTLTVMTLAAAKKADNPVRKGSDPADIPKDQHVVTQIIPVRFIGAVQLARDLQTLMPAQTTMIANEAGNALIITDTQANIRRLAEIIYALDTSVSSLSAVRVFALRYADAKTVADTIKEVFAGSGTSGQSGAGGRRGGGGGFQFGGFGGFGGPGGGGNTAESSSSSGRPGASKVVATADERSNSLVVSAPDDLMPTIEQLITAVDLNVEDITEIRVFRLQHADPQETATLLGSLFPDPTAQSNQRGGFGGFFRGGGFGQGGNTAASGDQSDRMKKQTKVLAVADNRTRSVVVTAARDTMEQIGKMVEQLDNDPARQQKVFVFEVQNTDPEAVQQALQDLFSGQRSSTANRNRTTTGQAGSQLNNRAQQRNQNSGNQNTGFGGGNNNGGGNGGFGN
jgi:type II secretory pathway component GspD/PulD (secretin)